MLHTIEQSSVHYRTGLAALHTNQFGKDSEFLELSRM